jgi:hypothetical protein
LPMMNRSGVYISEIISSYAAKKTPPDFPIRRRN